jgi:hypothetical protein
LVVLACPYADASDGDRPKLNALAELEPNLERTTDGARGVAPFVRYGQRAAGPATLKS